jgi:site-specific DNA recombinase
VAWKGGCAAAGPAAGSATATTWFPGSRGVWKINETEAAVVVRIFDERAVGRSSRAIAAQLNEEKVPGPRGGPWRETPIRGHFTRGIGILNNEAYIGRRVWNRQGFRNDPASGRRRARRNPSEHVIVKEVSELRIVSDELWNAVKPARWRSATARG